MSTLSVSAPVARKRPVYGWTLHDGLVVTRRNLIQTVRVPELLFFSLVQPVIFVLLFAYVFGGAIPIPGDTASDAYRQYLMPGIFGQTVAFAAASSTVGLAEDMHKGLIDRFRSLPTSRASVLAGRTLADVVTNSLSIVVLVLTGLIIGFSFGTGPLEIIGGFALMILFGYAFSWIFALIGMSVSSPEAANGIGFTLIFPITFISSAFVPVDSMPAGLQWFAEINPITDQHPQSASGSATCRALFTWRKRRRSSADACGLAGRGRKNRSGIPDGSVRAGSAG